MSDIKDAIDRVGGLDTFGTRLKDYGKTDLTGLGTARVVDERTQSDDSYGETETIIIFSVDGRFFKLYCSDSYGGSTFHSYPQEVLPVRKVIVGWEPV